MSFYFTNFLCVGEHVLHTLSLRLAFDKHWLAVINSQAVECTRLGAMFDVLATSTTVMKSFVVWSFLYSSLSLSFVGT